MNRQVMLEGFLGPAEAAQTPNFVNFRSAPSPALTKDTLRLGTHIRRLPNPCKSEGFGRRQTPDRGVLGGGSRPGSNGGLLLART